MARCGCSSSTCSCLVTGAGGVTVTGVGAQSNPYVITGPSFTVADTRTVDLTITGTGSALQPYILSAVATVKLDDLTDVDVPNPAVGNSLVWQTSPTPAWRAGVAGTPAPGTVSIDPQSLVGAGSAGSPLGVLLDPAGGLTKGPNGISASRTGVQVVTSTTRPASPYIGMRIYETDTGANGIYVPKASGNGGYWSIVDTIPQKYTPIFSADGGSPSIGGGTALGNYMRNGSQITVWQWFLGGPNFNGGQGNIHGSVPFPTRQGQANSAWGSGFLHCPGWAYFQILVQVGAGTLCNFWAPESPTGVNIWMLANADSAGRPGTGVPRKAGTYPLVAGCNIESTVTYLFDPPGSL